ncbi:hypothetical protein [Novosphingobium sp. PY1]|uniref:hypothetical protein n=1 Tax=Novosphingobium sp. PY1 TaxID=1882221 RepID=UPI001A8EF2FD|nr:hypothetical protein [Novosphingobium sp. PY1]
MELLEWLRSGVELALEWLKSKGAPEWIESIPTAITIILALVALLLIYQEFAKCFILLRRMNPNQRRGSFSQVFGSVLRLAFTDRALLSLDRRTLARRTRILIEHEMFSTKPQPDWRDSGTEPVESLFPIRAIMTLGRWRKMKVAYWKKRREWWKSMRRALAIEGNWTIYVDNPALVSARIEEIDRYFECLRSLGYEGEEGDRFICPIEIASGFVTPLHLLTGLLVKFDQKWPQILESFDRDANTGAQHKPLSASDRDLRQIQLFIYNCWLLWGPSIPICECRNWAARYSVIQYGFGDENNSIEIVGESKEIRSSLDQLMAAQIEHERAIRTIGADRPEPKPFTGMAIPANVIGRVRLSGSLGGRQKEQVNALPRAALSSWGGSQDERPVLFISEIVASNAVEGDVEFRGARRGRIAADANALPSRYYSAYLWAAIVVLVPTAEGAIAINSLPTEGAEPWKDFIPFFEHGNLADPESCLFGKRQLATKVITGLASALRDWGEDREPLHFAFACAIDEAGCGHSLAYPEWSGHVTMRELIGEALNTLALTDPIIKRMRDDKLLDMKHFSGAPGQHDFSACGFPTIVASHYARMESAERML